MQKALATRVIRNYIEGQGCTVENGPHFIAWTSGFMTLYVFISLPDGRERYFIVEAPRTNTAMQFLDAVIEQLKVEVGNQGEDYEMVSVQIGADKCQRLHREVLEKHTVLQPSP